MELWQQLLWSQKEYVSVDTERDIAQLLLEWPLDDFVKIAAPASSWLDDHSKSLDAQLLWPLWDRIADASLIDTTEVDDE